MSSPLQSLKKNKVPLYPGHMTGNRPIPFRHPEYSEDESRLLEEITTSMVQERCKRDSIPGLPQMNLYGSDSSSLLKMVGDASEDIESNKVLDDINGAPSDKELLRIMMNRIALLEQQNVTKDNELRSKEKRIKVLEDKIKIMEKARQENDNCQDNHQLEKHCLLLQQQVHEMETFLAEYGMVWVGDEDGDESDVYVDASVATGEGDDTINDAENNNSTLSSKTVFNANKATTLNPMGTWRQDTSISMEAVPYKVDFDLLLENIQDLNVLAGEGIAQIKKTTDGARFQIPDPIQLTIYANGILMFNGPFRPYSDRETQQCIQDLLDGYFPSELQQRYPDGIPFRVTDLRDTFFQPKNPLNAFTGEGQTLGGETRPSRLIPTGYQPPYEKNLDTKNLQTTSHLPGKPLTQAQYLNKLPKSVIKDGKVIDVRSSIENTLSGNNDRPKSNITLLKTDVTKEMSDSVATSKETSQNRPKSYRGHSDVTTLRVVTENGDHTYIVKMKFKETIGNLRSYLDAQRRPKAPYDIVSTFPHKIHKNNNMTLEASGLTPNAVIHLKPCSK